MYKTQKNLKHEKIEVLDYGKCGKPEQSQIRNHDVRSHRATKNQWEDSCSLRSYFAHVLHSVRISNVDSLIWVNGIREMLKFKLSNNIRQDDPFVSSQTSDEVKTFWVSMKNRTLPGMNIHEETWVCKKKVNSVLHSKSCLFWFIKTSQHSFPFLPSWTTLEQWELLCFSNSNLSVCENILAVIVHYSKLPNYSTMHCLVSKHF